MTIPFVVALACLIAGPGIRAAGDPNACDVPGEVPDVVVGDIQQQLRHGEVGGITAFSIGTVSCNQGSCWLKWLSGGSNEHPVIGQNMYRLKDGRFEQIGQSWLKHGFFAVNWELCSEGCIETDGSHLGVNCADPYSAFLNGKQDELGPKFEVNPTTGTHPHPVTDQSLTGDDIYKRLQVHNVDLDPLLNPGALYYVEGQYVTADDSAAGNGDNNVSHRPIDVSGSGSFFDFSLVGETQREEPAIKAWAKVEPGVAEVELPTLDGLYHISAKATDLGGGTWNYEYAVYNQNSDRGAMSFSVPVPLDATVTNVGFHDVDYHSGEPYDGTDWSDNGGSGGSVTWTTQPFVVNQNANALRWGTLYNFRFDADVPPAVHDVTLGFFKPGASNSAIFPITTPSLCNANGTCDPGETCNDCAEDCADNVCEPTESVCSCAADCGMPPVSEDVCTDGFDEDCDGSTDCADVDCCAHPACSLPDSDGDGFVGCGDCEENNDQIWSAPGEVFNLTAAKLELTKTELHWEAVGDPGGVAALHEVVRSVLADDFITDPRCFSPTPGTVTIDPQLPASGFVYYYLVRATNDCPDGDGPLGQASDQTPRVSVPCDL